LLTVGVNVSLLIFSFVGGFVGAGCSVLAMTPNLGFETDLKVKTGSVHVALNCAAFGKNALKKRLLQLYFLL